MKKNIIILVIGCLLILFVGSVLLGKQEEKENVLSSEEISEILLEFIHEELLPGGSTASLEEINRKNNVYELKINIEGEEFVSYASLDGEIFFPEGLKINLSSEEETGEDKEEIDVEKKDSVKMDNTEDTEISDSEVVIYNFWGDGCPFCAKQKSHLEELDSMENVTVIKMETWDNQENKETFQEMAQAYETDAKGVPMTFIGEEYWPGFSEELGLEMEEKVKDCLKVGCINPGDKIAL